MPGLTWHDPAARAAFEAAPGLADLLSLTGDLAEPALAAAGPPLTTARTRRLYRLELAGRAFYIKVQVALPAALPLRKWASYATRPSPLVREARAAARLEAAGFPVAPVLAVGGRGRFPGTVRAALVVAAVEDHVDLEAWLRGEPSPARRAAALDAADELLARVHAAGLALGGASLRNLLVPRGGDGTAGHVLIDQPALATATPKRCTRDSRRLRRERGRFS